MITISSERRDFLADTAPTADAIVMALRAAVQGHGGAWVGAVPAVVRDVVDTDPSRGRYVTGWAWGYEWPTVQPASAVPSLLASIAAELGAGWSAPQAIQSDNAAVAFWRSRAGWGAVNPNAFPVRGAASALDDPWVQGGLTVGGVGLGFWLLHRWLR